MTNDDLAQTIRETNEEMKRHTTPPKSKRFPLVVVLCYFCFTYLVMSAGLFFFKAAPKPTYTPKPGEIRLMADEPVYQPLQITMRPGEAYQHEGDLTVLCVEDHQTIADQTIETITIETPNGNITAIWTGGKWVEVERATISNGSAVAYTSEGQ